MLASRFALIADFEKDWPREEGRPSTFDPALRELCEATFGERFDDVGLFV